MPARARNLATIALTCVMAVLLCLAQTASAVAAKSPAKTASGNFFGESNIYTGEILPESLQPQWEIPPITTQLASGRQVWLSPDPIGEQGGLNLYGYVKNEPTQRVDLLGLRTYQIGISLGGRFFGDLNLNAGFVFDDNGGIGFYRAVQLGVGAGAGVSGGIAFGTSNGDCIEDMAGPFTNISAEIGGGIDGSAEGFWGEGSKGQPIVGGGFTAGIGVGAGFAVGRSNTWVDRIR